MPPEGADAVVVGAGASGLAAAAARGRLAREVLRCLATRQAAAKSAR